MSSIRVRPWMIAAAVAMLLMGVASTLTRANDEHHATPTAWSCHMATPVASPGHMGGMNMGTPMAGDEMDMEMMDDVEVDLLYIDMMIPHHASIIALSETALPRLTDERLIAIANAIVENQGKEIAELKEYREQFYGDAEPATMDQHMMDMMMEAMPGMGSGMDSMMDMSFQMDAHAQVNAFCAGENPDLTFIDLVIPHHQMAIASSRHVAEAAVHEEIRAFAQRVIEDQQAEVDELTEIRAELAA
jgi:uncharacterized protein (DUF305 family)